MTQVLDILARKSMIEVASFVARKSMIEVASFVARKSMIEVVGFVARKSMIEVASFVARKSVIEVTGFVARKSPPSKHSFVESSSPKSSPQGSGLDDASFLRLAIWSPQIILSGTWLVESTSLNWSPVTFFHQYIEGEVPFQTFSKFAINWAGMGDQLKRLK